MSFAPPNPISGRAVVAILQLLDGERLMTLACNRSDGWPHATTVGYLSEGLNLYFIIARTSQKFANLQADSRASVVIRSESGGSGDGVGLSMSGRAVEVTEPGVIERLNRQVSDRFPGIHAYCPSGDSVAVMHFRPAIVSAVGVADGRSAAETFTLGEPESPSVSQLF